MFSIKNYTNYVAVVLGLVFAAYPMCGEQQSAPTDFSLKQTLVQQIPVRMNQSVIYGMKSLAFSPDGKTLVAGSNDNTIRIWQQDQNVWCLKQTLDSTVGGHEGTVTSVVLSPDGNTLVSGAGDGTAKIWQQDQKMWFLKQTLERQNGGHLKDYWVQSVVFSPDGTMLVTGSLDTTVKIWQQSDKSGWCCVQTLTQKVGGHSGCVNSLAFSSDGETLVSGSSDDTVKIWHKDQGSWCLKQTLTQPENKHTYDHYRGVKSVVFSPDGRTLAFSLTNGKVKVCQHISGTWRCVQTFTHERDWHHVERLLFSPDGSILASGSSDRAVNIWKQEQGLWCLKQVLNKAVGGHDEYVNDVAFSPDGTTLASCSGDYTVKIWQTGAEQRSV